MNLTISGHHLESPVTPSLREYVVDQAGPRDAPLRPGRRHQRLAVPWKKQKEKDRRQKAEVNLHVKGRDIFVETAHEDLYAAIDQLMDKLDRQVCRHKDRMQAHDRGHPSP